MVQGDLKIIMVGLEGAGKTTLPYKLQLGEVVETIPTVGFNVELDCLGHGRSTQQEAAVADVLPQYGCADIARMEEVAAKLRTTLEASNLRDAVLLVFANKQDMPQALDPRQVAERVGFLTLEPPRPWRVQGCSAMFGDGLIEGLDHLAQLLEQQQQQQHRQGK